MRTTFIFFLLLDYLCYGKRDCHSKQTVVPGSNIKPQGGASERRRLQEGSFIHVGDYRSDEYKYWIRKLRCFAVLPWMRNQC
jgi:hypothetical protein